MGLPDGRQVRMGASDEWPNIAPEEMPWVELIEERPAADMAPIVLVDNRATIDALLKVGAVCGCPGEKRGIRAE